MKITFCGAAKTVTGSCYLVETAKNKFLVDCGMFQGVGVEDKNLDDFHFNPAEVDFLILTHAHIDHSGLIPKLTKKGFKGKIYLTPPTSAITRLLLLDSAKIQENNSRIKYNDPPAAYNIRQTIYDTTDALEAISRFVPVNFHEETRVGEDLTFEFIQAGHILGAASVLVRGDGKLIVFSGDIGRVDQSLIEPFETEGLSHLLPDFVVMESLYGGIEHESRNSSVAKLVDVINSTVSRGGNVIIPIFAVHRAQEMLEIIKIAISKGRIKSNVQTFLDSPLANEVTKLYTANAKYLNSEFNSDGMSVKYGIGSPEGSLLNRFNFENLNIVKKAKKSLKISGGAGSIILAGSGMADGGRVVHHLAVNLGNGKNSVIFVGFQAPGTLGNKISSGEKTVKIGEQEINVKAHIEYIHGFSAHGDDKDLRTWLGRFGKDNLKNIFLVHSEIERSETFKKELTKENMPVTIPDLYLQSDLV